MVLERKLILVLLSILLVVSVVNSTTYEQLRIEMNEYVDQRVYYNPLDGAGSGTWYDGVENQSYYNLTGYIIISNRNSAVPISDIYLNFTNTQNMTLPTLFDGRIGYWLHNDTSTGSIQLHIPEISPGENSTWIYDINETLIRPPLNFTTHYSDYKLLAGDNITITDTIQNVFDNLSYQSDSCIFEINITQRALPVNFSNSLYYFYFIPGTILGTDASNVSYDLATNLTMYWDALNGGCLNKDDVTDINYNVTSPYNIPTSKVYEMMNTTLRYKLNQTVSHIKIVEIVSISEANISFEKKIKEPSHPILYGSNVTWNVTGYFSTGTNITYNLSSATFWVSQRNVNGVYTDPNTVDNDSINTTTRLITNYQPGSLVNISDGWTSSNWLFNYSDIPSPIVWMDINFSIQNDGTQLINRSVIQNGNDYYIKELYLIIGYWLEVEKNISLVGKDKYHLKIDVHNKGNQVTPAGSVVTIYDFVPSGFVVNGTFVYSSSPWYNTTQANTSISGPYNGTLYQWALISNNSLNTSFAQGPAKNENTTWSVNFNVSGQGDYTLLDVFITGLDPQKVDGAGSTRAVVVSEVLDRLKSTEGIFAVVASVLLLLGLLL